MISGKFRVAIIGCFVGFLVALFYTPAFSSSFDNGIPDGYEPAIYNGIPAQQFKDVFETETIEVSGIEVTCDSGFADPFNDTVHFRVFNSTTQETEYEIDTVNSGGSQELPPMQLKKNHNYIFFVEDPKYMLGTKKYVQILPEGAEMAGNGAGAYDYKYVVKDSEGNDIYNKEYKKLTGIKVYKRSEVSDDPRSDARFCIGCPSEFYAVVTYNGEPVSEKLKFRFESELETFNGGTDENGVLYANLLEDVTYMVYLDSGTDKYVMDPFPIVVKDKSEYKEGRFAYNHTTCTRIDPNNPVKLFDAGKTDFNDQYDSNTTVTSLKGRVTVSGMSFRHLLILDRVLNDSLAAGMAGKDYEVISITAVNPHRWEISKLVGTDFSITKKIDHNRLVTHVYYIDKNNDLQEIGFEQKSADEVSFTMDSLSIHPAVIEFDPDKTYEEAKQEEADKGSSEKEKADQGTAEPAGGGQESKANESESGEAVQTSETKETSQEVVVDRKLPVPGNVRLSAGKKKLTVKWKKITSKQLKIAGNVKIEVQYSLSKKFPANKTKSKLASKKKTSSKISKLKSKKTYYVRVRTVKTVNGRKHVSKWSKIRKARVK